MHVAELLDDGLDTLAEPGARQVLIDQLHLRLLAFGRLAGGGRLDDRVLAARGFDKRRGKRLGELDFALAIRTDDNRFGHDKVSLKRRRIIPGFGWPGVAGIHRQNATALRTPVCTRHADRRTPPSSRSRAKFYG